MIAAAISNVPNVPDAPNTHTHTRDGVTSAPSIIQRVNNLQRERFMSPCKVVSAR